MTPLTQHSARSRPRPATLAAAAAVTGLLVLSQPGTAMAAEQNSADGDETKTSQLHPTIAGTDGTVRYSLASLAGGGVQVSFVYVPDEAAGEASGRDQAQSKEFMVTVDAQAVATQTVTDDSGTVVPATDDEDETGSAEAGRAVVVEQNASAETTEVTLKATTAGIATVWVLPQQAPTAVDPVDQNWVTRTWHLLVDKISGSGSGDDETDGAAPTETPTSSPTSSATSSLSPSDRTSPSPSSSSTSPTASTSGTSESGIDDTCVVRQSKPQLTSTAEDGTVNAPLEDGPSTAPTFSDDVREKAAQQSSECGEGFTGTGTGTGRDDQDQTGQDDEDAASPTQSAALSSGKSSVDVQAGDWLSGISGERPAAEKLRGVESEVATTWADDSGNVDQLNNGAEFGADTWDKSLILGIPPFPEGSSWEATAAGDNDDYARKTFTSLKQKWGDRDGQAFVEWGYEMNGYWMWWNARAGQEEAVAESFARVRAIQQEVFPEALLGVRFNHESNGYDGNSEDLIAAAKPSIDFIGASYYNAYPPVSSQAEFDERATMRDGGGGPKGIGTWLQAAKTAGLPIEFGEWAESAKDGDSAPFIDGMHQTFEDNAGPGAGQIFAESYFNIDKDDDNWRINSGRVPKSAAAYGKAFSDVGGAS